MPASPDALPPQPKPLAPDGKPSLLGLDAAGLATALIGAGEPALPGISIGHNERIAFGLTIFGIDQEDLYVYQLNPDNPGQYRYGNGWEDMRLVRELVEVDLGTVGPLLPGGEGRFAVQLRGVQPDHFSLDPGGPHVDAQGNLVTHGHGRSC